MKPLEATRLIFQSTLNRALIVFGLAGMLTALLAPAQPADAQQNRAQPGGAQSVAPARAPAPSLAPVLKKITPAVVSIETKFRAQDAKNRRRDARDPPGNVGSGVVFDAKRGLIITNNHVIDRADDITVTFTDGRMFKAKRVGTDPEFDLAVISVDADNLPSLPFGDSRQLEVGDFVLAIGYPANIGQSVTSGIVSGLHRTNVGVEQFENFIQTDAAIYPGNSGGALVDLQGDLVGINTAYIGATSTNPGMGFAIPVNTARIIADQIIEFGDVRRGTLGITTDDPSPDAARDAGRRRTAEWRRDRQGGAGLAGRARRIEARRSRHRARWPAGDRFPVPAPPARAVARRRGRRPHRAARRQIIERQARGGGPRPARPPEMSVGLRA